MIKFGLCISGGETGADLTGLEEATKLGIPTGGFTWEGYFTEKGRNLDLRDIYGLRETKGNRTELNAALGDCTIWFGFDPHMTGGGQNTLFGCKRWRRPMFINPRAKTLIGIIKTFEVVNIAGNRESINPTVVAKVRAAFDVWRPYFVSSTGAVTHGQQGEGREIRDDEQVVNQGTRRTQSDRSLYRQG
jgi:hypothetical protein